MQSLDLKSLHRVPLILQGEKNECGLACLAMVFNHHGSHDDIVGLRKTYSNGQPLSLEGMKEIAKQQNFETRALRCELGDLSHLTHPAILHVDFDHYVVLERINQKQATLLDPAAGKIVISIGALSQRFTGIALELKPGVNFTVHGSTDSFSATTLIRQLPLASLFRPLLSLLFLSFCVQAFALISPLYVQIVIDEALMTNSTELIPLAAFGFSLVYLTSALTQWFRGLVVIHVGNQLSYSLSAWLFQHLLGLHLQFFERRSIGDIVSRFSSLQPIQQFVTASAIVLFLDALMAITTFIMLACYSINIAAVVLGILTAFFFLQYALYRPLRMRTHEAVIADAKVQSHLIETLQSISMIKRFQVENRRDGDWLNRLAVTINCEVKTNRIQLTYEISRYLLAGLTLVSVVYIAAHAILAASMTLGVLYSLVAYTNHLTQAVLSFTQQWQSFLMLSLHVQRASDILDAPTDVRTPASVIAPFEQLQLRDISFLYHQGQRPMFDKLSLTVNSGESVAILGPSGCGKSTLLKILGGELSPTRGEFTLNGRTVTSEIHTGGYFSSILQTDHLIAGSIADNITFMDPFPDNGRLTECAKLAYAHEHILQLPLGYHQLVGELGSDLSAGQQQRILIARALYRAAPILLLDEGTCHLDQATEQLVMSNILNQACVCIFITHRSEIAMMADHCVDLGECKSPTIPSPGFRASTQTE